MAAEIEIGSVVQLEKQDTVDTTKKLENINISFSIWPQMQRTRDAAITERIEDEAFVAASALSPSADDDDIEVLQTYSKDISKWMLDYMKSQSDLPVAASALDEERVQPSPLSSILLLNMWKALRSKQQNLIAYCNS
ncbi:hypothetical protein L2E82_21643 [Cichorium intybus]|uniref:Uncharacterized protein n=1 Tax=Cichorium intybus TaxID=13427 RepID=A0ACB9DVT0_CICIN|nr:hypothetical protein L2E82_21643 [Cichorium intybus]